MKWPAQSETYNPSSLADFSRDFAKVVVASMEQDGLLRRGSMNELAKERNRQ